MILPWDAGNPEDFTTHTTLAIDKSSTDISRVPLMDVDDSMLKIPMSGTCISAARSRRPYLSWRHLIDKVSPVQTLLRRKRQDKQHLDARHREHSILRKFLAAFMCHSTIMSSESSHDNDEKNFDRWWLEVLQSIIVRSYEAFWSWIGMCWTTPMYM